MRELFLHNWWLKLLALMLATFTWVTVRLAIQSQISLEPQRLGNVSTREFDNLRITLLSDAVEQRKYRVVPSEVSVRVKGNPILLRSLKEKDIQVFVNLTEVKDAYSLIRRIEALCPPGVELERLMPPVVRVERLTLAPKSS